VCTNEAITECGWIVLLHTTYRPYPAPSNFHLFGPWKAHYDTIMCMMRDYRIHLLDGNTCYCWNVKEEYWKRRTPLKKNIYLQQYCSEILRNFHKCNLYIKCVSFYQCAEHNSCHMSWQMQAFSAIKLQCLVQ